MATMSECIKTGADVFFRTTGSGGYWVHGDLFRIDKVDTRVTSIYVLNAKGCNYRHDPRHEGTAGTFDEGYNLVAKAGAFHVIGDVYIITEIDEQGFDYDGGLTG